MRLRKVKGAMEKVLESPFVVTNPEEVCGSWAKKFSSNNPIHLEIGCGKGKFLKELANTYTDINYIGMEMMTSVILRGIEKMEEEKNILFINKDANNLLSYFKKGEVSKIYLNFSDPWPKKRHEKRRLTSINFLKRYKEMLNEGSEIEFKTDNKDLYDFSLECFNSELKDVTTGEVDYSIKRPTTEYEDRFRVNGPIYFIKGRV